MEIKRNKNLQNKSKRNESEKEPKRFNLFPNTGHHYFFIPVEESELEEDTKKKCLNNERDWKVLKISETENNRARKPGKSERLKPWVRWCFGTRANVDSESGNDEKGIYLCIDTTLGPRERGTFGNVINYSGKEEPNVPKESPYVAEDEKTIGKTTPIPFDDRWDSFKSALPCGSFEIEWQDSHSEEPRDVDLVVDFGNTRTVVLALERKEAVSELSGCCKPIVFLTRRQEYDGEKPEEKRGEDLSRKVVDSWFVLREHEFGKLEKKPISVAKSHKEVKEKKSWWGSTKTVKEEYWQEEGWFPQQFVEISPTIMGKEASKLLSEIDLSSGRVSMSSPKRYLWDGEKGVFGGKGELCWSMAPRKDGDPKAKKLSGQICRYTFSDGRNWSINEPPFNHTRAEGVELEPPMPSFPRRETMVWSALSIIEMAYREITSEDWRKGNDIQIFRRLNSISLTYPSGWIGEEKRSFKEAWERAVNIFTLSHFENTPESIRKNRPQVILEVDEAVASQLPFVYSSISKSAGSNKVDSWLSDFGNGGEAVRVMTVDIGGGTMDISVVEYTNYYPGCDTISHVHLKHQLLFRDCNTHAGDDAMKLIIETVLLPSLFEDSSYNDEKNKDVFAAYFCEIPNESDEIAKRSRFTKLIFIPIVQHWLSCLSKKEQDSSKGIEDIIGPENSRILEEFNEEMKERLGSETEDNEEGSENGDFIPSGTNIFFDYEKTEKLKKCIGEALAPGINPLKEIVSDYNVDLIVLSGKITEVPVVYEKLKEAIGGEILEQNIIKMKDYDAGTWYPMSRGGKIPDAKTVTVVGAALHRAFTKGNIKGWKFEEVVDKTQGLIRNYWGVVPNDKNHIGFSGKPILTPDIDENNEGVLVSVGAKIGRMISEKTYSRPEQIYILEWKQGFENTTGIDAVKIKLRRKFDETGEFLELSEAIGWDGKIDYLEYLNLKFCTLDGNDFWADQGRFDVNFDAFKK